MANGIARGRSSFHNTMVDFARINHIKHVIECDYDSWRDVEVQSEAFLPLRWNSKMLSILSLPVPVRDEPPPVAGEIDTAARKQKKEEGNMYGNNGYGNGITDDYYGRLDNTKPVNDRDPFIGEGDHKLVLVEMFEDMHRPKQGEQSKGVYVKATFQVLESRVHAIGSTVVKLWYLQKPSKWPSQPTDADRFADFIRKLKGAPEGASIAADVRKLLKERAADQLARGVPIMAFGRNTSKKVDKPYVDVTWTNAPASEQEIAANRQRIEMSGVLARLQQQRGQQAAPQQQAYAPPGGYQLPPAQYQQQPPQQQWQPQIGQPPAQPPGGYGQPPMQAPPQQWGQPQQPPAQPAPQQGGYVAQLPPPSTTGGGRW